MYSSSLIADACILEAVYESRKDEIEEGLERYLDFRQLAVLRMLQGRMDEAITLLPIPFMYMRAGEILYETGSGRSAVLLPPSPLRTVRESFPSYGSSTYKPCCSNRASSSFSIE